MGPGMYAVAIVAFLIVGLVMRSMLVHASRELKVIRKLTRTSQVEGAPASVESYVLYTTQGDFTVSRDFYDSVTKDDVLDLRDVIAARSTTDRFHATV